MATGDTPTIEHGIENAQEGEVEVTESKAEQLLKQIEALLESVPNSFKAELQETVDQIQSMTEQAREAGLSVDDIADFQIAMESIAGAMKDLVSDVQSQLGKIEGTKGLIEAGLLEESDLPEGEDDLSDVLATVQEYISNIGGLVEEAKEEYAHREVQKEQRIRTGEQLAASGLDSHHLAKSLVPEFVPSGVLAKQLAAFEEAKKSGVDAGILEKSRARIAKLESDEREQSNITHADKAEQQTYVDRIAAAMEDGTIPELFAEDGFEMDKAMKAVADSIRTDAFELDGMTNEMIEKLPEALQNELIHGLSDKEFWDHASAIEPFRTRDETSILYTNGEYKKRLNQMIDTVQKSISVVSERRDSAYGWDMRDNIFTLHDREIYLANYAPNAKTPEEVQQAKDAFLSNAIKVIDQKAEAFTVISTLDKDILGSEDDGEYITDKAEEIVKKLKEQLTAHVDTSQVDSVYGEKAKKFSDTSKELIEQANAKIRALRPQNDYVLPQQKLNSYQGDKKLDELITHDKSKKENREAKKIEKERNYEKSVSEVARKMYEKKMTLNKIINGYSQNFGIRQWQERSGWQPPEKREELYDNRFGVIDDALDTLDRVMGDSYPEKTQEQMDRAIFFGEPPTQKRNFFGKKVLPLIFTKEQRDAMERMGENIGHYEYNVDAYDEYKKWYEEDEKKIRDAHAEEKPKHLMSAIESVRVLLSTLLDNDYGWSKIKSDSRVPSNSIHRPFQELIPSVDEFKQELLKKASIDTEEIDEEEFWDLVQKQFSDDPKKEFYFEGVHQFLQDLQPGYLKMLEAFYARLESRSERLQTLGKSVYELSDVNQRSVQNLAGYIDQFQQRMAEVEDEIEKTKLKIEESNSAS